MRYLHLEPSQGIKRSPSDRYYQRRGSRPKTNHVETGRGRVISTERLLAPLRRRIPEPDGGRLTHRTKHRLHILARPRNDCHRYIQMPRFRDRLVRGTRLQCHRRSHSTRKDSPHPEVSLQENRRDTKPPFKCPPTKSSGSPSRRYLRLISPAELVRCR